MNTIEQKNHLMRLLEVNDPSKRWVRNRVIQLLEDESAVPSLSVVALRLSQLLSQDANVSLDEIEKVISLDQGLATRCIKTAGSVGFGGHAVSSIREALMRIGMNYVRQIALTIGVIDRFSHLRVKVDWKRFWLHSLIVARVTDRLASAFRETNGLEYLAGLLHDVGKLIIQQYFPREFEMVVLRAMERHCGHAEVEKELLGLDHAQIGAAMCHCLHVHEHVQLAVRYHHDPLNPFVTSRHGGEAGFLAACVAVADALTNLAHANIEGVKTIDQPFEELPEWKYLENFDMPYGLDLDMESELEHAQQDLHAFIH